MHEAINGTSSGWMPLGLQKQIGRRARAKLAILAGMAFALAAPSAMASIVVHDLTQDPTTGVYTYSISLDASANVELGDGFVIEDFPGLTSFTITGGLTTSEFTETSSLLSNSINQSASVDAAANLARTADSLGPDNPTVPNLSFSYDSSVTGGISVLSVVAALDHSGAVLPGPPIAEIPSAALTENAISVPQPVPEPSPVAAALLGLAGFLVSQGRRISRTL